MNRDEGYIKFHCDWKNEILPAHLDITELISFRNKIFNNGLIGMYPDGIGFGNVSQRISKTQFIISGSATGGIPELNKDHFSVVDHFSIEENTISCRGPIRASSESLSHAAIYKASPACQFVLHIHHLDQWKMLLNKLPSTAPDAAYGTPAMANSISQLIEPNQEEGVIIMAGHEEGILLFGSNTSVIESLLKKINLY